MSDVRLEQQGHVGIAEIDRPPNNFFDKELIGDLAEAFDGFVAAGLRAIVLCAAGRNFCAGANFSRPASDTVGTAQDRGTDHLYRQAVRLFRCPVPVIAAVQGAAVGGGLGLSLVGDFRVASEESRFTANFSRLGFHPGFGLSVTLPRVVGAQQAALLFYTGRRITGSQARDIGLVDLLVPTDEIRPAALALAEEIAVSSPIAVQSTRATLRAGLADAIAAATEHELAEQQKHFATADFKEGVRAMAERRAPAFTGA
ncbi:enoyl-CoA hydratase/isomerase family protein [Methylobacterium aquaticum]|uniref:enoyl-CoA hydratase/isomerase family protein n=1 Tax=Methylobacterium aquaticum TaxID=270351 RepID=UPI003D174416